MDPHVIRVPVPHTPHEVVLVGSCDCVRGGRLAECPPIHLDVEPEYYEHLHEAYVSFMIHWVRRSTQRNPDGDRYWAVHWGDAHLIAVKDRSPDAVP